MESHAQPRTIRWAPLLPRAVVYDRHSTAHAAGPAIVSSSSRAQTGTRETQDPSRYDSPDSSSIGKNHSDVPMKEYGCAGQDRANELPQAANLSESTTSAPSTAPSTDNASEPHTSTSSASPPTPILQGRGLDGDICTIETRPMSGSTSAVEVIEICEGTFVAVTQEPGNEDKLQWRTLSKRIHMAFAKTCRRYPNLSLQFKLAGPSADHVQPVIFFICPPETQKQVRKFLKKQKWLSEAECGYKNMIVDGTFLRVALDGEGGLDGGLFIRADMGDVHTLCGKLGRLEGALSPTGAASRFTIGGVVVVNDTLCCLTTGHVLFDGHDTSGMASSDDEGETEDEERRQDPVGTDHLSPPSRTYSHPEDQKSHEDGVAHSRVSQETRIGRLLTTSNWKRGIMASNEDWSLIQLDAMRSTDEWIVNRFQYPGTEFQNPLKVTIDKLARTEDEVTEAEVIVLGGCTGLQKGRLNTTAVQLYLDNATFEAREIVTDEPLRMGDSGSWVVQGSTLLGHVFAVQDGTPWSYMIPIAQVVDDIQKSLLTCNIKLPTLDDQFKVSSLCPEVRRSHASLVAFGVNVCPSCKQDLSLLEHSQQTDTSLEHTYAEDPVLFGDDVGSISSSNEGFESPNYSDHSIKASTVPTSYIFRKPDPDEYKNTRFVPFSSDFIYRREYLRDETLTRARPPGGKVPYIELNAVLEEIQPPNVMLERLIRNDASILLDFGNPINYNVKTTKLTLVSPSANRALRHVVRWDPSVNQRWRQIVVTEPYAVLVHHFPQLTAYAAELRGMHMADRSKLQDSGSGKHSTSAKPQNHPQHEDVEALIDFTQRFIHASNVTTEYSRHERNTCTFGKLWLLFHPGMTVYARGDHPGGLAAYVINVVDTDPSILRQSYGNGRPYLIHMWRLNYDTRYVIRQMCTVAINYFDGERDITDLKVFPCEYLDRADSGKTRRKLEEQGRRWYRLLRNGATYYDGKLPAKPDLHYEGPVVVDRGAIQNGLTKLNDLIFVPFKDEPEFVHEERKQLQQSESLEWNIPGFPWACYGPLDPEKIETLELSDDQAEGKGHRYLLCTPYLPGFLIKQKDWAWIDVNYCSLPKMNSSAIDRLLQPDSTKDIIWMLVEGFKQFAPPASQDSRQRKRSGSITILLHGNSGIGKRYTAECLAEAEGKVLMTIHPGELGSDAKSVRSLLSSWLQLAQTSDAIVLVPAADPFVQQGPMGERSDIISVFWACLEAHEGIVILTTSHAVKFDEVAASRITLPIHYGPFDSKTRQKVGIQLMRRLEEDNGSLSITVKAEELWKSTLQKVMWNGHEIKSVLENAVAMARNGHQIGRDESRGSIPGSSDRLVLAAKDLEAVVQSKMAFEEYVARSSHSESVILADKRAYLGHTVDPQ